jgi:hypothetical protein
VNTNYGELWLLDKLVNQILIANGGSRGHYVAIDRKGGLFVTQSEQILRPSLSGGTIGVGPVPEPSTWAMMILGFAGVGSWLIVGSKMVRHFASPNLASSLN